MDYYYELGDVKITQLKNIELINNTKNVHKSTHEMRTTTKAKQHEEKNDEHEEIIGTEERTVATTTAWMETLLANSTTTAKPTTVEYRTKDNHSDTDSALSSAPPSISPQPPSSGADSGVMWQALQDLDKLQKEVEIYHKENERLQNELQLMKQELLSTEKAALSASGSSKSHINELLQRIKELEEQQLQLSGEADELREQNELLEFRILELEDDKMDGTCEDHCQRLENLLRKSTIGGQLEDKDKRCLQQLLQCVQQLDLDAMTDYDSWQSATKSEPRVRQSSHSRIVATVQPYTNSTTPSVPTTPSKRACNGSWQNTSLSESGVFVECDLLSTHTDTETETERLPQSLPSSPSHPHSHPHLQYYQERLVQLEGKLLVYESSGETQAKHLAERLQREVQLNKQVKELIERVELLVEQNALLDEAKCEFEEAENDTRLHLQRNEEELEILRQRNVELEFSKDALGAKYRDCRAECLILREDLSAAETQLEHLQSERQRAKQQLESLRRSLPLLLICRLVALAKTRSSQTIMGNEQSTYDDNGCMVDGARLPAGARCPCCASKEPAPEGSCCTKREQKKKEPAQGSPCCFMKEQKNKDSAQPCPNPREVAYLKEEVKSLRCSLQELNTRHYEAMETADSHWVELEREYKAREEAYRAKEVSLKQKICKLQECLREDSRAAAEKIQQLEETEQGLKCCLVRITKEHRDLVDRTRCMEKESEARSALEKQALERMGPLCEELESEKRRSQALIDDLAFTKKLQQSMEEQLQAETDCLRQQIYDLKKELMHIEVTNGELREEVCTLEAKICELECKLKESLDRACCLEDELRTKDEQIELMERKLGVCPEGHSLADELFDSPEKRAKLEEIADLEAASQGLGCALRDLEKRDRELPTHKDFQTIACSVKQLADAILSAQKPEVSERLGSSLCGKSTKGEPCECSPSGGKTERDGKSTKGEPCECSPSGGQAEASKKAEEGESCNCRRSAGQSEATDNVEEDSTVNGEASEDRFKGGTVAPSVSLVEGMSILGQKLRKQLKILTRLVCREELVEIKLGESKQLLDKQSSARLSSKSSPTVRGSSKRTPRRRSEKQSSDRSSTVHSLHQEASDVTKAPSCSSLKQQVPQLHRRRHQCKRFITRRIYRTRVRLSGATNRPIELMPLKRPKKDDVSFHSMMSLHSLHTDRSSASTQTQYASLVDVRSDQAHHRDVIQWHNQLVQASVLTLDQQEQTDVLWGTQECAIQADNVGVEQRLLLLPTRTRAFIALLQEKIVDDGSFNVDVFRSRVLQLWEGSEEFREHIELLQDLNATTSANMVVNYDIFVAVLGCVRALKLALKPCSSSLLLLLEERINERLINFHHRKVESEFYCTIYLPVERRNSLKLTDGKEQGA